MALASNVCNMNHPCTGSKRPSVKRRDYHSCLKRRRKWTKSKPFDIVWWAACLLWWSEAAAKACLEVTREYQRWDHWAGHGSLPDRPSNLVALYSKIQLWLLEHQRSYELLWCFSFSWRGCQFKWWVVLTLVQWCLQVYTFSLLHWWLCCLRRHSALRKAIWHLWWLVGTVVLFCNLLRSKDKYRKATNSRLKVWELLGWRVKGQVWDGDACWLLENGTALLRTNDQFLSGETNFFPAALWNLRRVVGGAICPSAAGRMLSSFMF